MFYFKGDLPASKSWVNRMLVIQHFNPQIDFDFHSNAEDILNLKKSILNIKNEDSFYLGQGGTSLRFFAFLISRKAGTWTLNADQALLARPQNELKEILEKFEVQAEFFSNKILIKSSGWKWKAKVEIQPEHSSQFVSGLLLSTWGLEKDLQILIKKNVPSFSYLQMTLNILRECGMKLEISQFKDELRIFIPAKQEATPKHLKSELDVSSAFSLAANAVVGGDVEITNWKQSLSQPDKYFLEIFNKMKIHFVEGESSFKIQKQNQWLSVQVSLEQTPDLFPVLAALCALANGNSELTGAQHLIYKESDRIKKTEELLVLCGYQCEKLNDGIRIFGQSSRQDRGKLIEFSPEQDHRLAFAAHIFKLAGFNIKILNPEVVNKSYSDFWKHVSAFNE